MVLGVASPAVIKRSCVLFVHHRRSRVMEHMPHLLGLEERGRGGKVRQEDKQHHRQSTSSSKWASRGAYSGGFLLQGTGAVHQL